MAKIRLRDQVFRLSVRDTNKGINIAKVKYGIARMETGMAFDDDMCWQNRGSGVFENANPEL